MDFIFALLGGILIGLASVLLWVSLGRVAGVSGIISALFVKPLCDYGWRLSFILGLVLGGFLTTRALNLEIQIPQISFAILIIAGLLVGFGTVIGSGCTSGHGVCGLGRLSRRSLVAVLVFMMTGMLTVTLMNLF